MRRTSSSISCRVRSETSEAPGKSGPLPSRGIDRERADGAAHAPAPDHLAGDLGELLDVRLGAGRGLAEDDLLGAAAAERDLDLRQQLALLVVVAIAFRRGEGDAERRAARDDRDLAHRIGALREHADDRMTALVVGGAAAVLGAHHDLPLRAEHDPLQRVGEVGRVDLLVVPPRGEQRRLVDEVGEVGADHPGRGRRDPAQIDVGRERHVARVHLQDLLPPCPVGRLHRDAPVEPARPEQRRSSTSGRFVAPITITPVDESKPSISVRIWFSVCSRSSLPPLKPAIPEVRERPIASSSSMNTIAGAASFACANRSRTRDGADPDDRLDELRRRHREERRVRLACDRARQQRLAGSRRPRQQHAVRDAPAEAARTCPACAGSRRPPTARPWPRRSRPRPRT